MSALKTYHRCPKCNSRSRFSPGDVIETCKSCGSELSPSEIEAVTQRLMAMNVVKKITGKKDRKNKGDGVMNERKISFPDIEWGDESRKQSYLKDLREEGWEPIKEELVANKHETIVTFKRMEKRS